MRSSLLFTLVVLLAPRSASGAEDKATVRFRLVDTASGKPTPAMVCISSPESGEVRLPPDGRVAKRVSLTKQFYEGIRYREDPGWVGPVRKMQGRGDNNDRSFVYEDRPSLPYWREPVMFQTQAEFSIELPPGRWRIAVSRGMEYVPVVEELRIEEPGSLEKTIRLDRWIDLASEGWYSGDVHVHHPTLEEAHRDYLLEYARAEDLRVVNVLEMGHHAGTDFRQKGFGPKHRSERHGYWLVSGQEEPRSTFGHIIGLNIHGFVRDVKTYDFYDIAFRGIHEQPGALVGFAHFAWNGCALPRGFPWYVTTGEIDFVELLQFGLVNTSGYADYLNLGFRLSAAAGSDVPWGSTIGEVRTYVYTGRECDIDRWFEGLGKGTTFVSNGPAIDLRVDGRLPGAEVELDAAGEVRVSARTRGHPKVGLPRELVVAGPAGAIRKAVRKENERELRLDFSLEVPVSQWLVAHTACDNGAVAHTSPVYVVIDGQPTWCVKRGPAVVRRQLEAIEKIRAEFIDGSDDRARGILERLDKATAFYETLLEKMGAAPAARGRLPAREG